ncbi:MAG: hypothetical protein HC912_10300 [Saprospiraceae bacterium]|nr:hypothetical protein [Saprospiraceae bacterium]
MVDLGYKKIITTPHIMSEYYPNTPDRILNGLAALRASVNNACIEVELEAAAEYFVDETF